MEPILPDPRRRRRFAALVAVVLACCAPARAARPVIHHALDVTLVPARSELIVEDRLTLPRAAPVSLSLHAALKLDAPDATLTRTRREGPYQHYRLVPAPGARTVSLRYRGRLPTAGDGTGIGADFVYLDAAHAWVPRIDERHVTFTLSTRLPAGWTAVSQGEREGKTWRESQPQQDIHLVAARFHEYRRATPWGEALVFLRRADAALAERYLEATPRYLALYSRLIGPYPYKKFALIENIRETGFGMPSFTLLGPRVIRLPFIINTSYPHEILHNWWGNGVYVGAVGGNWAEALTSYLADHLLAEREGRGPAYRLSALLQYADYVTAARDFPLAAFRGNHGEVSQAIGYNKGLMFFHMLRLRLGDERFLEGVRRFYREHRFRAAGFKDLRAAMEAAGGQKLGAFFEQWTTRAGAPTLTLSDLHSEKTDGGYRLRAVLRQTQDADVYALRVPVAIVLEGRHDAHEITVDLHARRAVIDVPLPARPLRMEVDPRTDVFRWLDPAERPPSLAQLFASERPLFVLPAAASAPLRAAYDKLARQWARSQRYADLVLDAELDALPHDREVWVMGWENRYREQVAAALPRGSAFTPTEIAVGDRRFARQSHSVVAVAGTRSSAPVGLLASDSPQALAALARKLPHYDRYSYAVFAGASAENVEKGRWPPTDSPLQVSLVAGTPPATLPPRPPLAALRR